MARDPSSWWLQLSCLSRATPLCSPAPAWQSTSLHLWPSLWWCCPCALLDAAMGKILHAGDVMLVGMHTYIMNIYKISLISYSSLHLHLHLPCSIRMVYPLANSCISLMVPAAGQEYVSSIYRSLLHACTIAGMVISAVILHPHPELNKQEYIRWQLSLLTLLCIALLLSFTFYSVDSQVYPMTKLRMNKLEEVASRRRHSFRPPLPRTPQDATSNPFRGLGLATLVGAKSNSGSGGRRSGTTGIALASPTHSLFSLPLAKLGMLSSKTNSGKAVQTERTPLLINSPERPISGNGTKLDL